MSDSRLSPPRKKTWLAWYWALYTTFCRCPNRSKPLRRIIGDEKVAVHPPGAFPFTSRARSPLNPSPKSASCPNRVAIFNAPAGHLGAHVCKGDSMSAHVSGRAWRSLIHTCLVCARTHHACMRAHERTERHREGAHVAIVDERSPLPAPQPRQPHPLDSSQTQLPSLHLLRPQALPQPCQCECHGFSAAVPAGLSMRQKLASLVKIYGVVQHLCARMYSGGADTSAARRAGGARAARGGGGERVRAASSTTLAAHKCLQRALTQRRVSHHRSNQLVLLSLALHPHVSVDVMLRLRPCTVLLRHRCPENSFCTRTRAGKRILLDLERPSVGVHSI